MRKLRMDVVIAFVASAMIALLLIQFYQVSQLYDRKSIEFKAKVQTLVERIAIRHEKAGSFLTDFSLHFISVGGIAVWRKQGFVQFQAK